ncbi:MAG: polyprenyl synthetase family protein [Polyangiaceae bacterium]|jgi:geranylgeranyl diphosphate synthase type I
MKSTAAPLLPHAFDELAARVRVELDAILRPWLESRVDRARGLGPDVQDLANAIRDLALRGGKRFRAILLVCAFGACGGEGGLDSVGPAAIAIELLQTYLLIHDDWMDDDDVRRGGPSVPAVMRARFPEHADEGSVLAGDLAAAWARAALMELRLEPSRVIAAARELARVEQAVVEGQWLDVRGFAHDLEGVEAGLVLKTASYTTSGPVAIGAVLAGSDEGTVAALAEFADPLGIAFQLRDDLLDLFGDAATMGKPGRSDLRKGKRTSVVLDAMRDPSAREAILSVLGRADATDSELSEVSRRVDESGARRRVEVRIECLVQQARAALDRARLRPAGHALLSQAALALTERGR